MSEISFDDAFKALTDNPPFPWQRALYDDWFAQGKFPASCNLPTGLGKTSVIAVWLIALANGANVPRRLVYVVNRRTVVDQTTDEVEKYKKNLAAAGITSDLALSTLRGQFADNREWSADPSRPAVICGTVDMIGSRLLFSGYGVGFKGKPLHAGFLGQDALLIHDEAHLEPAFQALIESIEKEQARCKDFAPLRVMELTATSRGGGTPFELTEKDKADAIVQKRVGAKKAVTLTPVADEKKLADDIADLALSDRFKNSKRPILIFVRKVDDVEKIVAKLDKAKQNVQQLTGTLRGLERDRLPGDDIFRRFLPNAEAKDETVYLVCTSAGEVGVNISADHLITDLSTFESMAQRFGRVNRFGERDDTEIHVFYPSKFEDKDIEQRREKTLALLRMLNGDGSPAALGGLAADARIAAFAPPPTILPTSDILFDAWALTSIRGKLPGRPPVAPYLHGISTWEPPETHVAWRHEVQELTPTAFDDDQVKRAFQKYAAELLEDYPLKPHELLRENSARVYDRLKKLKTAEETPVWVVADDETVTVTTLGELIASGKDDLGDKTLLLPPIAGGLRNGLLASESIAADDVADEWYTDKERTTKRRVRAWGHDANFEEKTDGMRLVRRIDFPGADDEDAEGKSWHWYERPAGGDGDGSKSNKQPVTWQVHTDDVVGHADGFLDTLPLPPNIRDAVKLAAKWHDLGKQRKLFQTVLGNFHYPKRMLAKSGKAGGRVAEKYRHEFGSLTDVRNHTDFKALSGQPDLQDLILHLIAVHHGRGRPHFSTEEAFDPHATDAVAREIANEVPRRFARLQRRYGRWGLAYLESLLRAADYAASANPSEFEEVPS